MPLLQCCEIRVPKDPLQLQWPMTFEDQQTHTIGKRRVCRNEPFSHPLATVETGLGWTICPWMIHSSPNRIVAQIHQWFTTFFYRDLQDTRIIYERYLSHSHISRLRATSSARTIACALLRLSWYSSLGTESATTPPPAWKNAWPSLRSAVRMVMHVSRRPSIP